MSLAESQHTETTIIDGIRFVWAAKWYMLAGLVVGLLLAYPATTFLPDTINRTVTLTVYPSGAPTDTALDIQNQLAALLARKSFTAVPARTGPNLTISMPYKAADLGNADGKLVMLATAVSAYRVRLLAKVSGAYFDLQQRDGAEGRAETLVKFRAWQDGIADGSIDPVRITATESDRRMVKSAIVAGSVLMLGLLAGALVAWATSAVRELQRRSR